MRATKPAVKIEEGKNVRPSEICPVGDKSVLLPPILRAIIKTAQL